VPLLAGKGDADFLHIFEKVLAPVAAEYRPEFILASIGFDIAAGDPLGAMEVTSAGFGLLTASLMAMASKTAGGRLAMVLEGGYDLTAMREGVRQVLRTLDGTDGRTSEPGAAALSGGIPVSNTLQTELAAPLQTFRRKWDIPA
jgi:acetoin utilization deacetylase AcuC-like enzyme